MPPRLRVAGFASVGDSSVGGFDTAIGGEGERRADLRGLDRCDFGDASRESGKRRSARFVGAVGKGMKVKLAEMNSNGELSGNKKGHLVTSGLAESGELQMHQNIMHDLNDGLFVGHRVRRPDAAIHVVALPTHVCRHCCPSNRASKTSTYWATVWELPPSVAWGWVRAADTGEVGQPAGGFFVHTHLRKTVD